MNAIWLKAGIPAVALLLAVGCAPVALAEAGESSAPAAGTPTAPSAAAPRRASTGPASADHLDRGAGVGKGANGASDGFGIGKAPLSAFWMPDLELGLQSLLGSWVSGRC
jgi:hypothetical protein